MSVQGLGRVYDELVRVEGAHVKQMKALRHPFCVVAERHGNCVYDFQQIPYDSSCGVK